VWKPYSACRNQACAYSNHTRACCNHIRECHNHIRECHNHTHMSQNLTLRVEITIVSVVCRNHIRACQNHNACGNHTRACRYHTRECHIHKHTCQNYSLVSGNHTLRVEIVLAFRNQSCACSNHSRACWNHICACQNHTACRNYILRVGIRLKRGEITLLSVIITRIRVKLTLVCKKHTLRVEIVLCV
jgi:hypothetical protein